MTPRADPAGGQLDRLLVDDPPRDAAVSRARLAVIATFLVHGLVMASWTAHIPEVKAALGLSNGQLGLALLGAPTGSVSAVALAGFLVPRIGSRRMVLVTLVGYALSGSLVGLAGSLGELFAALLLWGAFQGALDVSMNAQAIAVEHRLDKPIMNTMHGCWSIGALAGAGVGASAVALGVPLAPQLLVAGVPAAAVTFALCLRMLADRTSPAAPDAPRPPKQRVLSATMGLLGAITFASMLCEGAASDWSSVYLRDSVSSSAAVAGLGYAAFALAMVLARLAGDRMIARFGARVAIPALAVVAAAGLATALAVGMVAAGLVAFFLLGLGVGAVVPTTLSAAGRLPGVHPGQAVAGVSGLGWAGFLLGPPLIGSVAGATSLPLALGVLPLLCVFIAAATVRVSAMHVHASTH